MSLLNVDTKILSKAISNKLKTVLPTLISSQRTAYLKKQIDWRKWSINFRHN